MGGASCGGKQLGGISPAAGCSPKVDVGIPVIGGSEQSPGLGRVDGNFGCKGGKRGSLVFVFVF